MDIDDLLTIIVVGGIAFLSVSFILNATIWSPIAQNNAQIICVSQGYETYIDYSWIPYTTTPMALYCGTYEQRMIQEGKITAYTTDKNSSIIISDLNQD